MEDFVALADKKSVKSAEKDLGDAQINAAHIAEALKSRNAVDELKAKVVIGGHKRIRGRGIVNQILNLKVVELSLLHQTVFTVSNWESLIWLQAQGTCVLGGGQYLSPRALVGVSYKI